MNNSELDGKVALVTGSSRGIGRAIALRLASCGADVVLNYVSDRAAGEEVLAEIERIGRRGTLVRCDVSKSEEVDQMVRIGKAELGSVDILVNNAGQGTPLSVAEADDSVFHRIIDVNMKGLLATSRAVLPDMVANGGGRIIAISSVTGQSGKAFLSPSPIYAAAKAGVIGMIKGLAREGGSDGITANAVCPGWTDTDATSKAPKEAREDAIRQIPLGRTGRPEDIAGAVSFLASDDASYITGVTLSVNGGLHIE